MSEEKQTKVPGAAELLEMANVQIAAEAFLAGKGDKGASPGNLPYKKITLKNEILTEGNTHTSRFSKIGAEDFIKNGR